MVTDLRGKHFFLRTLLLLRAEPTYVRCVLRAIHGMGRSDAKVIKGARNVSWLVRPPSRSPSSQSPTLLTAGGGVAHWKLGATHAS